MNEDQLYDFVGDVQIYMQASDKKIKNLEIEVAQLKEEIEKLKIISISKYPIFYNHLKEE